MDPSLFDPDVVSILRIHTALARWVNCLALVDFSSEVGHKLVCIYPPNALELEIASKLTKVALPTGEKRLVDGVSGGEKRLVDGVSGGEKRLVGVSEGGVSSSFAFQLAPDEYGFANFRVLRRKGQNARAWQQRSVVIVTPVCHFKLFTSLAETMNDIVSRISDEEATKVFAHVCLTVALDWPSSPLQAPVVLRLQNLPMGLNFEAISPATDIFDLFTPIELPKKSHRPRFQRPRPAATAAPHQEEEEEQFFSAAEDQSTTNLSNNHQRPPPPNYKCMTAPAGAGRAGAVVQGSGTSALAAETVTRSAQPTANGGVLETTTTSASPAANAASPTANAASPTANAASPAANAASPTANAASPTANAASPTANAASPTANAASPTANAASRAHRTERSLLKRLRRINRESGWRGSYSADIPPNCVNRKILSDPKFFRFCPEVSLVETLGTMIPCVLAIWEAILFAEPLLVFTTEAQRTSQLVLALSAVIAPLIYKGDCRPIIDTFESDFRTLTTPSTFTTKYPPDGPTKRTGVLLGTINPICLNLMSDICSSILALDVPQNAIYTANRIHKARQYFINPNSLTSAYISANQPTSLTPSNNRQPVTRGLVGHLVHSLVSNVTNQKSNDVAYLSGEGGELSRFSYMICSKKSSFSSKDQSLFIRAAEFSRAKSAVELETAIRVALYELTEDFLRAFEPYLKFDLRPLMLNPYQQVCQPVSLCIADFLENTSAHGMLKLLPKQKLRNLYGNFLKTKTFQEWFTRELSDRSLATTKSQIALCLSAKASVIDGLAATELEAGIQCISSILVCDRLSEENYKSLSQVLDRLNNALADRRGAHRGKF